MFVQIIFFVALAVFIYLLSRRSTFNGVHTSRAFSSARGVAVKAVRAVVIILSKIQIPKFKVPKINTVGNAKKNASQTSTLSAEADNNFWRDEAIEEKPELSSHFEEGEQLFKKGLHKEAEQFFLKAATNNPGDPKVYARLGLLYLEQKNFSDAIEALKMATKLEKYNPSRHYNLSLAYWGNKDTRRAISSVREAISLDPITKKYRQLLEQLLNG